MNFVFGSFHLLVLFSLPFYGCSIEPVSMTAVGTALALSAAYSGWNFLKCNYYECCDNNWIKPDFIGLEKALKENVHGQPLVHNIIPKVLKGHLNRENPNKALVMSFHGWTGGGKNHVSKLIAQFLYNKGMKSDFVHLFVSPILFPLESEVATYKKELQTLISENVKKCPRSLFIFDEIDKMPPGLIDAIKPFIDYHDSINGVNYRQSVFIFLSNTGGTDITRVAFQFWLDGKNRNDITMKSIEPLINKGAFNEEGGLIKSDIIEKHLINIYVPFLPLEKVHVKLCIKDYLISRNISLPYEDIMQAVADELSYFPPEFQLYSTSGCKRLENKIDLVLDE